MASYLGSCHFCNLDIVMDKYQLLLTLVDQEIIWAGAPTLEPSQSGFDACGKLRRQRDASLSPEPLSIRHETPGQPIIFRTNNQERMLVDGTVANTYNPIRA